MSKINDTGWVKVYRKMQENPHYFSEPFCRNMAWIDLILLANHDDNFFRCRGVRVEVKRGQIGWGIEEIAKRWKWSRGKLERFLVELETDRQIVRQKNNVTTLISITNYSKYQSNDNANNKADGHQTVKQTVKQTDINKNEKNYKNEKNIEAFAEKILNPDKFPTWRQECLKFLNDDYFKTTFCKNESIPMGNLEAHMKDFLVDVNQRGLFKDDIGLKSHFINYYKKHLKNKEDGLSTSNGFVDVPENQNYEDMEVW